MGETNLHGPQLLIANFASIAHIHVLNLSMVLKVAERFELTIRTLFACVFDIQMFCVLVDSQPTGCLELSRTIRALYPL
jgi:hypothetical protein